MSEEIPLSPVGREEIHKLEYSLLVGTLFRPEVLEELRNPSERLTWIDSLAVAASALAREKAKMSVSQIAEELGRTEATIRNHLQGKTKAGQLILKTYEDFVREGVKIGFPVSGEAAEAEERLRMLEEKVNRVRESLNQILAQL